MRIAFQQVKNSSLFMTLIGAGLLCLCTQVNIPLHPVHISLQTVAVLIIGLTFSKADALEMKRVNSGSGTFQVESFLILTV